MLASAIYFEGKWKLPFSPKATQNKTFTTAPGRETSVPMMHRTFDAGDAGYWDNDSFQALTLAYKGDKLSMTIFLPRDKNGLPALEQSATPEKLQDWLSHKQDRAEVVAELPKFTLATGSIKMADTLQALGMKRAFAQKDADFSGLRAEKDIYIGEVYHKAYVQVDESGTKAAAASAVTGLVMNSVESFDETPVKVFTADHPFLFVIRDNDSGSILFMGRVTDPS